jgi:hypothetical protein
VKLDFLKRKPQLCGPFLAILFSELILTPLEFNQFLSNRLQETVTRRYCLSAFRHHLLPSHNAPRLIGD